MRTHFKFSVLLCSWLLLLIFFQGTASASVIPVGIGAFAGAPQVDFTGLPFDTEVNGLNVDGFGFSYLIPGGTLSGALIIDGGPGFTNNIAPPNIVAVGNTGGIIQITFPTPVTAFGYGFALATSTPMSIATTLAAFSNGPNLVGAAQFGAGPDPLFIGGFAGISSTDPFDRVTIGFSGLAPSFAVDNIRTAGAVGVVPEPSTVVLVGFGVVALLGLRFKDPSNQKTLSASLGVSWATANNHPPPSKGGVQLAVR